MKKIIIYFTVFLMFFSNFTVIKAADINDLFAITVIDEESDQYARDNAVIYTWNSGYYSKYY